MKKDYRKPSCKVYELFFTFSFGMPIIWESFCKFAPCSLKRHNLLLNFLSRITTSEKNTSKYPKTQRSRSIAQTSP